MNQVRKAEGMLSPTCIYDLARMRVKELKKIEKDKSEAIQKYPEGKIHIVKSRERMQYYLRIDPKDKSGTYLHKKDSLTIKKYVQKSYDEKVHKLVKKEIKSIEAFLNHSEDYNLKIQQIFSNNPPEIKDIIRPIDCSDADYEAYWESISYSGNPIPIQTTEFRTDRGELVRSKSELNIANALYKARIPYKYECPVKLRDGRIVYPDFTILDMKNRREIYWEHRGMMDNPEYSQKTVKKIKDYIKNGIVVGDNLIITEETSTCPLGTDEIRTVIRTIAG